VLGRPSQGRHADVRRYLRADPEDMRILDGDDDARRAELIAERLKRWKSITNA